MTRAVHAAPAVPAEQVMNEVTLGPHIGACSFGGIPRQLGVLQQILLSIVWK